MLPRVTIPIVKRSQVSCISSRLHNVSRQRTASMYVKYDVRGHTQHIATRTPRTRRRPRRVRHLRVDIARKPLIMRLCRDLGASARARPPHARVSFDPSQYFSTVSSFYTRVARHASVRETRHRAPVPRRRAPLARRAAPSNDT